MKKVPNGYLFLYLFLEQPKLTEIKQNVPIKSDTNRWPYLIGAVFRSRINNLADG